MNVNLLVDSSIWIRTQLPRSAGPFLNYLDQARRRDQIVTTGMIRLEVLVGMPTWEDLASLVDDFDSLPEVAPGRDTWTEAGRIGMRLHKRGIHLGSADLLIAAIALEHGLTLVHADRDFELLARHERIKAVSLVHLVR